MIKRVTDISLIEIMKKYLSKSESDFVRDGSSNRYKTVCPFHNDTDPSLILYDKTDTGMGWDYHCYPCGAHGTAPNMLINLGIVEKEDEAIALIMKDFGLELPEKVDLTTFSDFKGLDKSFLIKNGWEDKHDGVSIPFYDVNRSGNTRKVRIKYIGKDKYYYENYQNIPYGLHWLKDFDKNLPIYVAEGETDSITMTQAGYQALGIPSARDFQPYFKQYFEGFSKIVVVKDNDTAGDELLNDICAIFDANTFVVMLPSGVKDVNNFHLFRCGSNINTFKEKFNKLNALPATKTAFLNEISNNADIIKNQDAWKVIVKGLKTPIDKALFIQDVAKTKILDKATIKKMVDTADLESKIRGKRLNNDFYADDNCYFKTININGAFVEKQVSNFIIKPLYNKVTEEGDIRVVKLINVYNESVVVEFTPQELSSCNDFITKVVSIGRNNFYGNNEDLTVIRDIIFKDASKKVESPFAIGHVNDKHWIFENCGIDSQGVIKPISQDKIIYLDDKAYMPRSITMTDTENFDSYMPSFDLSTAKLNKEELRELLFAFLKNINSYNAWIGLGWCVANWYSDAVFKRYKQFPFLFIVGKRGQGKTTFASLLNRTFGYGHNSNGKSFDNSTPASMSRALNYSCSLPIWYDDYKDDIFGGEKDTKTRMLLGAYNRQGGDRASRASTGLDTRSVRSTLLISGEYSPSNSALKSRCITIIINGNGRDNTLYNQVSKLFNRLPANALDWLSESQLRSAEFLNLVASYEDRFEKAGLIERTSQNLAVVVAGFHSAFADVLEEDELEDFIKFAISTAQTSEFTMEEAHHIPQFFNDLTSMLTSQSSELRYGTDIVLYDGRVKLKRNDVYRKWQAFQPNKKLPVNEITLKTDLENEKFYCKEKESRYKFGETYARTWEFDLEEMRKNPLYNDFIDTLVHLKDKNNYTEEF